MGKAKIVVMKKDKAPKEDITNAVTELKRLKAICELPAGSAPAAKAAPAQVEAKAAPVAAAGGPARNPACSDADWNALEALKAKIVVMKKEKAAKDDITNAVTELKRLKAICELPAGSAPAAKAAPAQVEAKAAPVAAAGGPARNPACS